MFRHRSESTLRVTRHVGVYVPFWYNPSHDHQLQKANDTVHPGSRRRPRRVLRDTIRMSQ